MITLIVTLSLLGAPEAADQNGIDFFEKRVRPLLAERCFECHSGKAEKLQAGLSLDSRESILRGGDSGAAIVPGKPDESLLIRAVRYASVEMPPSGKLKKQEIDTLVRWVELGAPWPAEVPAPVRAPDTAQDWEELRNAHWSWKPPVRPELPRGVHSSWPRNSADYFVLAHLEDAGLKPAPPADRRTLIRRLYFDLIGVPPTPEDVQEFIDDQRPEAYPRLVERLLSSPQYGERWARHWLDVARYSDGHGGFLDPEALPHAWRYRDWIVRSLNRDLPYDEFVRQQIVGDLLDDDESFYGPGFFAIGPSYNSDGGDPDSIAQSKAETLDDRVDTFSRAFLALTISCSRCHDHKFDPIPTLDYYSIAGVFQSSRTHLWPLVSQGVLDRYNAAKKAVEDAEKRLAERREEVLSDDREPTPEEQEGLKALEQEVERLRKAVPPHYPAAHTWPRRGT